MSRHYSCKNCPPVGRCDQCKAKRRARRTANARIKIAAGLCRDCSRLVIPGQTRCELHQEANTEASADFRQRRP